MNISGQGNWMDKLFHKKLSGFEVTPEDHIWDGIARRLDESQKRPALFGSWWTILFSIIMVLLVTGAGAYMLYKKYYLQKTERNQNKDLPYLDKQVQETGTASLTSSDQSLFENTSKNVVPTKTKHAENNLQNLNSLSYPSNQMAMERKNMDGKNKQNDKEIISNSTVNDKLDEIANIQTQVKANDLIVSADKEFYTASETANKNFYYSYLPLKESFLKHNNKKISSPMLLDGCNVYRNDKTHFFLDVYYAPEIANRTLKTNDPALYSYVQERSNSERPILSYSAGVKASFVFSNGMSIRSGISYSNNSERFDYVKETQKITKEIKDQNGNVIRTEITELVIMDKIYNQYKFLDIPILLGYEKDLKDFILSINGGVGLNLYSSQTGKIYKDDKNPKSFYTLESNGEANQPLFRTNAGLSLVGSIGLNYKYNERIMVLLEPSARYYVQSLSDPANPVSQNYLFLGINLGLRYRLK